MSTPVGRLPRRASALLAALFAACFLLPAGTAYALWSSTATSAVSVSLLPAVPSAPTNLTCALTTPTTRTLSWTAVSGATSYAVYRTDTSAQLATVLTGTSALLTKPLTGATSYPVVVRAVNLGGESANSAPVTVTYGATTC